jgi:hypothetical protein
LYLAALAAVRNGVTPEVSRGLADRAGTVRKPSFSEITLVVIFAVLTPLFVWLVYGGKVKTAGKNLPLSPRTWPLWEMFASAVAFLAWAFAMPDSPFTRFSWYNLTWGAFVVLAVSTALGLLSPIFHGKLAT